MTNILESLAKAALANNVSAFDGTDSAKKLEDVLKSIEEGGFDDQIIEAIPMQVLDTLQEAKTNTLAKAKEKLAAKMVQSDVPPLIPSKPQMTLHWFAQRNEKWKDKLTLSTAKEKAQWKQLVKSVAECTISQGESIPGKNDAEKTLLFVFDILSNYELLRMQGPSNDKGLPVFALVPSIVQIRYHVHWLMGMYINSVHTGKVLLSGAKTFEDKDVVPAYKTLHTLGPQQVVVFGKPAPAGYVKHHLAGVFAVGDPEKLIAVLQQRMKKKYGGHPQ